MKKNEIRRGSFSPPLVVDSSANALISVLTYGNPSKISVLEASDNHYSRVVDFVRIGLQNRVGRRNLGLGEAPKALSVPAMRRSVGKLSTRPAWPRRLATNRIIYSSLRADPSARTRLSLPERLGPVRELFIQPASTCWSYPL